MTSSTYAMNQPAFRGGGNPPASPAKLDFSKNTNSQYIPAVAA